MQLKKKRGKDLAYLLNNEKNEWSVTRVKLNIEVELKDASYEQLLGLIEESVCILKERSNATHSNELLNKSSDDHSNAITEEKKTIKKPYKKNRKKPTRDFTKLDKIVTKYHGKKSYKEIIEIAAEKGITTDEKQLDYRRKKLGIAPHRKFARPKKTDDLNLIEEASELNLKGIEGQKNINDTPGGEDE